MTYLLMGIATGLAAGLSPGPLMALVVAESARGGWRRGAAAGLAPPLTDAAIIAVAVALAHRLPPEILRVLAGVGALFAAYLAGESLRAAAHPPVPEARAPGNAAGSFLRGLLTNLLNPHPYIFWFTVGVPIVLAAARRHWLDAALFLVPFFLLLVGTKVAIAVLTDRGVRLAGSRFYAWALRLAAAGLAAVSAALLYESLRW